MDRKHAASTVDRGLDAGGRVTRSSRVAAWPSRRLPRGEHPPGAGVGQALRQVMDQLGIGQHLDRLAQPAHFPGGNDVRNVIAMSDDRHRLAALGSAHDLGPRRPLLGADHESWLAHEPMVGAAGRSWRHP